MGCVTSSQKFRMYEEKNTKARCIKYKHAVQYPTEEQKVIVKDTWVEVKRSIESVGIVLFTGLFEKYPDVQQLFVHFRGLSADELKGNKRLRDHGLRVLNTLDKCISRIDETDRLEKLLFELGQKHVLFNIKVEYLELLVPQLQQALMPVLGDTWTYLVESAWSAFLRYIIHIMAEAMV